MSTESLKRIKATQQKTHIQIRYQSEIKDLIQELPHVYNNDDLENADQLDG